MRLSVLIPAFNEASHIAEVIARVRAAARPDLSLEIVVVDDGSVDGTARVVEGLAGADLRLIRHEANRGKGAAIRSGLPATTGDAVLVQDADLEYDPGDYPALLRPVREEGAQVVYGSRILGGNPRSYLRFYWGGRFVTAVFNLLYGRRLTDLTTCYKLFRRDLLVSLPLRCERFEFCPEVTAMVARRGIAIREVPIGYSPRSIAQGKKIRWHDGVSALWTLARLRLGLL